MTAQEVITPTIGTAARRGLFWVGAALVVVVIALVTFAAVGSAVDGPPLDSTNPAPGGAMAVAEVLRQQGVTVVATSTLEDTGNSIDDRETTTLFIYDSEDYLEAGDLRDAVGLASTVVLVQPGFEALRTVAPELAQAGDAGESLEADCSLDAVQKAGAVSGEASGYRVVGDSSGVETCLGSGDGVYSLVVLPQADATLTVLGTTGALTNEFVADDGNAALALNLLGANETLVWYIPGVGDLADPDASLGDLTPLWVTPVLVLIAGAFIAAAFWRGRRFGPLVIENLPVTVRANETMLGRARLYQKSTSRLRALDSLRIGSINRLARLCGLPRAASVDDVVAAVAGVTGTGVGDIRNLLIATEPATDRDLVALSDALILLERDVSEALRP